MEIYFVNQDHLVPIRVRVEGRLSPDNPVGGAGMNASIPLGIDDIAFSANLPWIGYAWKFGDDATIANEEFKQYAVQVSSSGTIVFGNPLGFVDLLNSSMIFTESDG